jgi:hypothetical protein
MEGVVYYYTKPYPYIVSYIVNREGLSIDSIPELFYLRMAFKIKEIVNDDIFLRMYIHNYYLAVDMETLYEYV